MISQETITYPAEQWQEWLDQLAANDYLVVDDFISDELYQTIQRYFNTLLQEDKFLKAAVGSAENKQVQSSIRGDFTYWLDRENDSEISGLFTLLDELVSHLNQHLFLSLSDYEFHFAMYPPGTRYQKHVDQHQGKNNRVLSVLIYLNEDWKPGDGGELNIYRSDDKNLLIEPIAKRIVIFKSDSVEHEVMTTSVSRKSLTGWLLHQTVPWLNH